MGSSLRVDQMNMGMFITAEQPVESEKFEDFNSDGWRTKPQLSLLIDNIPNHWMAADLKRFADGFGTVVKAEIFEDRHVAPSHSLLMIDWKEQRAWKARL